VLRLSGVGISDVGRVRGHNEDSAFLNPCCMLVADGVGGAAAGEVASATAAYVVSASVLGQTGVAPVDVLSASMRLAREQLRLGVRQDRARTGMATTLTAVVTDGERFALAHIGDSRGYLFRDGSLERITTDHTVVQRLVDEGTLHVEDVPRHPWRHMVLRTLGGDDSGNPDDVGDVRGLELRAGDRVLLASDGLTDLVSERRVEGVLARYPDDVAVGLLVDAALKAGGYDNVTCLLATVVEGPAGSQDGQLFGAVRDPRIVVDPAAVRLPHSA
jgi:serine/threonine protein phosphatase PrpC